MEARHSMGEALEPDNITPFDSHYYQDVILDHRERKTRQT